MQAHPFAGKPAPARLLANIPRLVSAYYTGRPDPSVAGQRISFGTSGHRGRALENSFNEAHILATAQAIVHYRRTQGTDRVPKLRSAGAHAKERMKNAILDNVRYTVEHGADRAGIAEWTWPH